MRHVAAQQRAGLGDVEGKIPLEAPGVEADRHVVGVDVRGGEVEIDQPGNPAIEEEHVVREQIGMDMPHRQVLRPGGQDPLQPAGQLRRQARAAPHRRRSHLASSGPQASGPSAFWRVGAKPWPGQMQLGQRRTQRLAMLGQHTARPHAGQEGGDGGNLARPAGSAFWPSLARTGSGQEMPACCQMLHQPQEPGQVRRVHPLLVQGEDEIALCGPQRVIAVLHALGDAADRRPACRYRSAPGIPSAPRP